MKINGQDVDSAVNDVKKLLDDDKTLSSALKTAVSILITLISLLVNQLGINSTNSSKPPSSDPNRKKKKKAKSKKKPGGQKGHKGTTLNLVEDPDEIIPLKIDRRTLPKGIYTEVGYDKRQLFDIQINRFVTEYQAQILEDEQGNQFSAPFPDNVEQVTQYGKSVKATSVYLSQYQMLPYNRIEDYFLDQAEMAVSAGSVFNFNKQAYELLETFDAITKKKLIESLLLHADETGINVNGKRLWLHNASSPLWTYFYPHEKRGCEAIDAINIIPQFFGVLCHDHWKPYYSYPCLHSLCNAHHLRELTRAWEQDAMQWAKNMLDLLIEINNAVDNAMGKLSSEKAMLYREHYRKILQRGEIECPPPDESERKNKRGRQKRSKARNLLERLLNFEEDVLRFMETEYIPFTNNQGENDLRMTKVQQKISGCFRSMEGARYFCRIRGYISTCRKHGINATEALTILFNGELPQFVIE